MKYKLLSAVIMFLAVIWSTNVKAASYDGYIYEDMKIPGVYFYKHREDTATEKYEYHNFHSAAAVHRRSSDNAIVYCIESWKSLTGASVGEYEEVTDASLTNLSVEQIDRIQKLAYFGYGYEDENHFHADPKWYAITQYMIWLVQAPNIEHYFVNSISSTQPINMFENEIQELNELVDSYSKMKINYNELIMLGKSKTIKVDNLNTYIIDSSDNLAIQANYDNNTIKVTPLNSSAAYLSLTKKYNRIGNKFKYYLSEKFQDAMSIGDLEPKVTKYNFKIETATIELNAFEENLTTKDKIPLSGYMYGIFVKEDIYINGKKIYGKNHLLASTLVEDGVAKFTNLSVGKYYIKELFYMGDYYDAKKVVDINVKDSKTIHKELYYHRQKLKVNLKKYLSSPIVKNQDIYYSLITKEGIKFGLYNENNELIAEATTNSTGDIEYDLQIPYGNYYIKEISTLDNYYLSEFILPIVFECKGNTEYQIIGENYEIINYHKKGTITISKIDVDTKKPLVGVKFAIYNANKETVKIAYTDDNGKISITLPYGNYYIQELSTLENYELDKRLIPFIITSEIQNMEITNKILESNKEEINNTNKEIVNPNIEYQPIEVELSRTDDNSIINIVFYLISSLNLILYRYVKKINF